MVAADVATGFNNCTSFTNYSSRMFADNSNSSAPRGLGSLLARAQVVDGRAALLAWLLIVLLFVQLLLLLLLL